MTASGGRSRIVAFLLVILVIVLDAVPRCRGFVPSHTTLVRLDKTLSASGIHQNLYLSSVLFAQNNDKDGDNVFGSSLFSSLPPPDIIKQNVMEGNVGERGEYYVIAQFGILFLIALGGVVPYVQPFLTLFVGPSLMLTGLFLVYKSAADLGNNLSPWPVPTDPTSGRGSLISSGIYGYVRHPMYSSLIVGMFGFSLVTESVERLVLTLALCVVLDAKSNYEEIKLLETYGSQYEKYQQRVPDKFFLSDFSKIIV